MRFAGPRRDEMLAASAPRLAECLLSTESSRLHARASCLMGTQKCNLIVLKTINTWFKKYKTANSKECVTTLSPSIVAQRSTHIIGKRKWLLNGVIAAVCLWSLFFLLTGRIDFNQ